MEKSKSPIVQTLICVVLLCMIWGGYWLIKHYVMDRMLEVRSDDFSCIYQVDSIASEGEDFVIRGFAFKLKEASEKGTFEVVLQDIETGETYFPKMKYEDRKDVNDYFLCEYDYTKSGFTASINEKRLDLQERNYEVLLKVSGRKLTYHMETYISKGKLMYTNPLTYEPLDVAGTDLEEIVEQGVMRVYHPNYGIYAYQYMDDLYWITDLNYIFVDDDTLLEYQIKSTQEEKLPEEQVKEGYLFDNRRFWFRAKEMTEWNVGKYRVARNAIPKEYAVTNIWTANRIDTWIWQQTFRPYYIFEE